MARSASRSGVHVVRNYERNLGVFRKEVKKLAKVLEAEEVTEVVFPATLCAHSGKAILFVAPVKMTGPPKEERLETNGYLAEVFLTTSPVKEVITGKILPAGVYAIKLVYNSGIPEAQFIDPSARVAFVRPALLLEKRSDGGIWDRIKELLKDFPFVINLEVHFSEPSTIEFTVLFGVTVFSAEDP